MRPQSFKPAYFFFLAFLFLWGALIYSNSFFNSFHFDDEQCIVNNPVLRHLGSIKAIWHYWPTRFVTFLSLALNYTLGGLHVFGYHLVNFLIHLATAYCCGLLVFLTLKTPALRKDAESLDNFWMAFAAGALFLVHPLATQPVNYIIQRATLLAALFYLASLCCYVLARLKKEEVSSHGVWKIFYAGSIVLALLSMFSKELAVSLPLAICLYEFAFLKDKKRFEIKWLAPFLVVFFIVPLTMFSVKMLAVPSDHFMETRRIAWGFSNITAAQYFLTQARVVVTYLRLLLVPISQNLDYDFPIVRSWHEPSLILSVLVIGCLLTVAFKGWRRYRMISFGIFWFLITLSPWLFIGFFPESNIMVMINDVIFEHRLYLAIVGFCFFMTSGLFTFLPKKPRLRARIFLFFFVVYSFATFQRNNVWKNEFTLWNDVVQKSPAKARGYNNRGYAYLKDGRSSLALLDFSRAIEIQPDLAKAYNNRGFIYLEKRIFPKALADFNRAIEIQPDYAKALSNRAILYLKQGDFDKALADCNRAINIEPELAGLYNNRGDVFRKKGDLDAALKDYATAIRLERDFALAYSNRGDIYRQKKEWGRALSEYGQALEIDSSLAEVYNNRANIYLIQGKVALALSDYARAIKINPQFTEAYYNRGKVYCFLNNRQEVLKSVATLIHFKRRDLAEQLKACLDRMR